MNNNLIGVLYALIAFASYSFMDGVIKYIVTFYNVPWQVLIFYVSTLILTILFLTLVFSPNSTFKVRRPFWLFIRAAIGVTNLHLVFFIVPKVHLDLFYSLVFVSPIIASIIAAFVLNEHLNIHKLISIIVGFMGILIITQPWTYFLNEEFKAIELAPLLVALTDAAIGIVARKYLINDKPVTLVFYQFILCTLSSGLICLYSFKAIPVLQSANLLSIVITAFFALGGYLFYIIAVQKAPVQIVLPMGYTQMVFGVIIGIALFSQYPSPHTIIGALVIIFASLYMVFYTSLAKNKIN